MMRRLIFIGTIAVIGVGLTAYRRAQHAQLATPTAKSSQPAHVAELEEPAAAVPQLADTSEVSDMPVAQAENAVSIVTRSQPPLHTATQTELAEPVAFEQEPTPPQPVQSVTMQSDPEPPRALPVPARVVAESVAATVSHEQPIDFDGVDVQLLDARHKLRPE